MSILYCIIFAFIDQFGVVNINKVRLQSSGV
jgi:hypothetical protein